MEEKRRTNVICPDRSCSLNCKTRRSLREHIRSFHKIPLEVVEERFTTFDEFLLWKKNMEMQLKCGYIKGNDGRRTMQSQSIYHYLCRRSGFSRTKTDEGICSYKLNAYCPSSIYAHVTENEVKVTFWRTHFGHGPDDHLLLKRIRKRPGEATISRNVKCPDSGCTESFINRHKLRQHIMDTHKVTLEMIRGQFKTYEDFQIWKTEMEQETKCSYILKQQPKVNASKETVYYYHCHRTGVYNSRSKGKRKLKSLGSKKIDGVCPSTLDVIVSKKRVLVEFWQTHFGHDNELRHMSLSAEEKSYLESKLKQGLSFKEILNDVRKDIQSEEVRRIDILTRKDLHNISRRLQLQNDQDLQTDDAKNVQLWAQSQEEAEDHHYDQYENDQEIHDVENTAHLQENEDNIFMEEEEEDDYYDEVEYEYVENEVVTPDVLNPAVVQMSERRSVAMEEDDYYDETEGIENEVENHKIPNFSNSQASENNTSVNKSIIEAEGVVYDEAENEYIVGVADVQNSTHIPTSNNNMFLRRKLERLCNLLENLDDVSQKEDCYIDEKTHNYVHRAIDRCIIAVEKTTRKLSQNRQEINQSSV